MDVACSAPALGRDGRLDFWRGVCLVDMLIVHLIYARIQFGRVLTPLLGEYTRFAAGGFVFCSGLCIGSIFLPRVRDAARRQQTYFRLFRRALVILLAQYACTASLILLAVYRGYRETASINFTTLWHVLTLRQGNDLLPLYVILMALSPLLLELVRRGYSLAVLLASAAVFAWGQYHLLTLPAEGRYFPPMLWQAVFVAGLLFGSKLRQFDALTSPWKIRLCMTAIAVFTLMCACDYGPLIGLNLLRWTHVPLTFSKVPLSFGELLRYLSLTLSILLSSAILWPRVRQSAAANFLTGLGRRALLVYVAHLFVLKALIVLSWHTAWLGAGQVIFTVLGLLALRAIVWLADITPTATTGIPTLVRAARARFTAATAWTPRDVAIEARQ